MTDVSRSTYSGFMVSAMRRPDSQELQHMARTIGNRCGADQVGPAHAMLQLMTDVLFGSDPNTVLRAPVLPPDVQRPSPRTLEAITQRIVSRSGNSAREEGIREMLMQLTDTIFGTTPQSKAGSVSGLSLRSHQSSSSKQQAGNDDPVGSQLCTARSSIRSTSTTSEEVKREVNQEVRGMLMELCGELFKG